jgi:hypothetical protein
MSETLHRVQARWCSAATISSRVTAFENSLRMILLHRMHGPVSQRRLSGDYGPKEYRGVRLPERMTPACLDELARLINMHGHEDNEETADEAAVRAFNVVARAWLETPSR